MRTFLHKIITYQTSSQKFYQIVRKNQKQILPKAPQETIISRYLKREGEPKHLIKRNIPQVKQDKKKDYLDFLQESPEGSVIQKKYKDVDLTMLSINYHNLNLTDIYQFCKKSNPDLVFIQARPQNYITSFRLLPKIQNTFSDRTYLQQLIYDTSDIYQHILDPDIIAKLQNILSGNSKQSKNQVYIKDNKNIVEDEIVLMSSFYAYNQSKDVLFGEIPEQPWREWICNSNTLMELQEIFKSVSKNIPFYESYKFSPYKLATIINPNFFLNLNDKYMSTLIQMLIGSQKYKKILCITGLMQNSAIEKILDEESLLRKSKQDEQFIPIIQYLIAPEIKPSLLRNTEGWQIIEKHIILDILIHGSKVINIPVDNFQNTNKIIDIYGRRLYNYDQETIMKFRFEKTLFYLDMMNSQIAEGEQLKKKILLREAIRQNNDY